MGRGFFETRTSEHSWTLVSIISTRDCAAKARVNVNAVARGITYLLLVAALVLLAGSVGSTSSCGRMEESNRDLKEALAVSFEARAPMPAVSVK